jgi:hypothetical protein
MLVWAGLFAGAFGLVEGAVVVYLREIAYPGGFRFPLQEIEPGLLRTEVAREAATLLVLLAMACAAGRGARRRFAIFAFCFGVWDIAYYVALKVFLDWPAHLLDWDVLFLIPVPWTAPVLAPVLVSLALIAAGVLLLRKPELILRWRDWAVAVAGGALVLASFFWNTPAVMAGEMPGPYPWPLFLAGWLVAVGWLVRRVIALDAT